MCAPETENAFSLSYDGRKIQSPVEVRRTSEYRADGALDRLNDLAVSVRVEAAHAIAIEKVDAAFLARAD